MSSPDKPFQLHGGNNAMTNMRNRIACIDRMEFILKDKYNKVFSFRTQTSEWLMLWDLEMYSRWYRNTPKDYKIDEQFCQHGAEVANAMIEDEMDVKSGMVNVKKKVEESYKEYISIPTEKTVVNEKPKNFITRFFDMIRKPNAS